MFILFAFDTLAGWMRSSPVARSSGGFSYFNIIRHSVYGSVSASPLPVVAVAVVLDGLS